jgi:hypothetical protein
MHATDWQLLWLLKQNDNSSRGQFTKNEEHQIVVFLPSLIIESKERAEKSNNSSPSSISLR